MFGRSLLRAGIVAGALLLVVSTASAQGLHISNPAELAAVKSMRFYLEVDTLEANTFASVKGIGNLFSGKAYAENISFNPRSGKNIALQQSTLALGYQAPGLRISAFERQDAWLDIDKTTLELLYANMVGRNLPSDQSFPIIAQFAGAKTNGIKLETGFDLSTFYLNDLAIGVGLNILAGSDLRLTQVMGSARQNANGYLYSVQTNDSWSEANYPYIRPAVVSAQGYTLDLGFNYRLNSQHSLAFAVNDAASSLVWRNMPNSQLAVSNQQVGKDEYGFALPSLSGINDIYRRTITQALEPKYQLSWMYQGDQSSWSAYGQWTHQQMMAGINYGWRITGAHWLELGWEQTFKALSLAYKGPYFKLKFQTQQPFVDQSSISQMSVAAFLDF